MQRRSAAECTTWLVGHDPLEVVTWSDPLVEQLGHPARSAYVETYWLSVIGPASTWAIRRLSAWLDAAPDGFHVSLTELSRELGLGAGTGRNSPVVRTLARLVGFGLATPLGDALAVRRVLAPLTCRQAARLPESLASQHDREPHTGPRAVRTPAGSALSRTAPPATVAGGAVVRSGKPATAPSVLAIDGAGHPAAGAAR